MRLSGDPMGRKILDNLGPKEKAEVLRMLEGQKKRLEEALDGVNRDIKVLTGKLKRKSTRKRAAK